MAGQVSWKEAASLIVVAKDSPAQLQSHLSISNDTSNKDDSVDFRLLMLKRSGGNEFLPGVYVYPGGRICEEDYSESWRGHFKDFCVDDLDQLDRELSGDGDKPSMITRHSSSWPIPPDIAFRICAIRETFEESAVLLIRKSDAIKRLRQFPSDSTEDRFGQCVSLDSSVLEVWRQKVRKDPSQFITLCRFIGGVPDVWSLAIWCNWLTPVMPGNRKSKRFDTMFYVCCLKQIPYAFHDQGETVRSKWYSPYALIEDNKKSRITLIGPQVYETCRIANFGRMDELQVFSQRRSRLGCERYMPVYTICSDGVVSFLPGDDLYPLKPDYEGEEGPPSSSITSAELFSSRAERCNRRQQVGSEWRMKCTGPPRYGHVHPRVQHRTLSVL